MQMLGGLIPSFSRLGLMSSVGQETEPSRGPDASIVNMYVNVRESLGIQCCMNLCVTE